MRTIFKAVVLVVGVVVLAFGIISIIQSGSAKQQVADSIAPLPLDQVKGKYDEVTLKQKGVMATEEPNIQAGTAAPSALYNYLTIQRSSLGLARTNIGMANLILSLGIVEIILGVGLISSVILIHQKE
ncbi:MAG: hypothetical protein PH343_10725 [Nitrospira sp.]|nr:hypothetical protein [Nitrospira sp.]